MRTQKNTRGKVLSKDNDKQKKKIVDAVTHTLNEQLTSVFDRLDSVEACNQAQQKTN